LLVRRRHNLDVDLFAVSGTDWVVPRRLA
jgi:hypothetical protein